MSEELLRSALLEFQPRLQIWLDGCLPAASDRPERLHEAMRYSLFGGGKHLRAALVVFAAELFDPDPECARAPACAVEMIHTYSLIHDDLPCMDDDDLRRGRPTSHRVYGEAMAILAGDALLTRGLGILAETPRAAAVPALLGELAGAVGSQGMVGGQVLDLGGPAQVGESEVLDGLRAIHRWKTAALIRASAVLGALAGGAPPQAVDELRIYGEAVGLAFQIADDVLDETGTAEQLGKTPGKDAAQGKVTYASLLGLDGAREMAHAQVERALEALARVGGDGGKLQSLARFSVEREC